MREAADHVRSEMIGDDIATYGLECTAQISQLVPLFRLHINGARRSQALLLVLLENRRKRQHETNRYTKCRPTLASRGANVQ